MRGNLNREFNSRLIIIDEIHNIRIAEDKTIKKIAQKIMN